MADGDEPGWREREVARPSNEVVYCRCGQIEGSANHNCFITHTRQKAEIAQLRGTLKLLAPYARRGVDSVGSPYGNDLAAHWALLEIERAAPETTLRLPDDPVELLVTTARDAGFSDTQWKAMFYEQGPYDVTFACFTTKKFIALLLERLQQPTAKETFAVARPLSEWHEDYGPVIWWKFPVDEPSWIGGPNDDSWPGYHTHWTPHPSVPTLKARVCNCGELGAKLTGHLPSCPANGNP